MYGKQAAEAGPLPRSCYHQASNAAHKERAQEIESAVRFRVVSISKPQHMQERYTCTELRQSSRRRRACPGPGHERPMLCSGEREVKRAGPRVRRKQHPRAPGGDECVVNGGSLFTCCGWRARQRHGGGTASKPGAGKRERHKSARGSRLDWAFSEHRGTRRRAVAVVVKVERTRQEHACCGGRAW